MTKVPLQLLTLPAEVRNKIWKFVFDNTEAVPLESSFLADSDNRRKRGGVQANCHGCLHENGNADQRCLTVAESISPLLTCRQIYAEALASYYSGLRVHVYSMSELQFNRSCTARPCAQIYLRHLSIRIHANVPRAEEPGDLRHLWFDRLGELPQCFPSLNTLHMTIHLRPPISRYPLIDAVYVAGPLCILPSRIKLSTDYSYMAEEVMIDHPDLGRIWYSDALDEHRKVIEECFADETFREAFAERRDHGAMATRLLQISQEHEQPWLANLRTRKIERDREEARMNARMNGAR